MAGSLKNFKYLSDDGKKYIVKIDESNGEKFGFDDVAESSTDTAGTLPRGYKMRYVNWRSDDGALSRKFPVGKPTEPDFIDGGNYEITILSGNTAVPKSGSFTYAVGEKRPIVFVPSGAPSGTTATDTGLNDSDAD